ncbi:MAG: sugar phosphate isomerase/epimerase family protein [Promethearchaeota archaeon]
MKTHWDLYCKIGIVHGMVFPECIAGEGPILETLTKIAEDGFFSAVDYGGCKDKSIKGDVAALLKSSRLTVNFSAQPALLLPKLNLNALDDELRNKSIQVIKSAIDEAYEIGAEYLTVLSGPYPGDADSARGMALLIDSLKQLCEYAKGQGNLTLVLEIFDRDIDKKSLIGPSEAAVELAKAVREAGYPTFGLMHDLSHLPLLYETPAHALSTTKDYLTLVHLGNCVLDQSNPLYGDLHPIFGVEGGANDAKELAEYLKALFDIGYLSEGKRPFVSFEVKPYGNETSEMAIANVKRTLKEAWTQV